MSYLFKIIPSNFFQLLSSPNKDIYVDCLLILDNLAKIDNNFNIDKNIALNNLEKYFNDKNKILLQEENMPEITINNRQKASKIIMIFKKNGWLGEERLNFDQTFLTFFDYSLEIIRFLKKTLNQAKPEPIGNIYSIYSLLKFFITEKNYAAFYEANVKSQNLVVKLKILKANIYRFYFQLLNTHFNENIQNILEQLLLDYKKNFFDFSYYLLKTNDNFLKYQRKINFFLQEIKNNTLYIELLIKQLQEINQISITQAKQQIEQQIKEMEVNFYLTDQLIKIIDQKNEEYLRIACERILFFNNQKENSQIFLNYLIQLILNEKTEYHNFFHFYPIKNLDELSFYKPRRSKQEMTIANLEIISEETYHSFEQKILTFQQDKFYNKKNIYKFVKQLLNKKNFYKASDLVLKTNEDMICLMLTYLYAKSYPNNIYRIQDLNTKVTKKPILFSDFGILLLEESNK